MNQISNKDLRLDEIPDPEVNWNQWIHFANSINGYEVQGGFEPCADLANGGEAKTLTGLRCALFFEARRERHSGGMSTNESLFGLKMKIASHFAKNAYVNGCWLSCASQKQKSFAQKRCS